MPESSTAILTDEVDNYLISFMKFLQTDWTFTAISWNSLQPELGKFLDECLHCFSLHINTETSKPIQHQKAIFVF